MSLKVFTAVSVNWNTTSVCRLHANTAAGAWINSTISGADVQLGTQATGVKPRLAYPNMMY